MCERRRGRGRKPAICKRGSVLDMKNPTELDLPDCDENWFIDDYSGSGIWSFMR